MSIFLLSVFELNSLKMPFTVLFVTYDVVLVILHLYVERAVSSVQFTEAKLETVDKM